jgi:hypothetical protein
VKRFVHSLIVSVNILPLALITWYTFCFISTCLYMPSTKLAKNHGG